MSKGFQYNPADPKLSDIIDRWMDRIESRIDQLRSGTVVSSGSSGSSTVTSGSASDISLDTTNFDGNLSASDSDVQTAMETLDEVSASVPKWRIALGA